MDGVEVVSEVAVLDVVDVWFPDLVVVMEGVEERTFPLVQPHRHRVVVVRNVRTHRRKGTRLVNDNVLEAGVGPGQVQQELNLVLLNNAAKHPTYKCHTFSGD